MPRAAIYARFSTDLQNERSVEDQIELCRAYCGRENLTVATTFFDRARSGASIFGRDGLIDLMTHAKARAFDVVVVEALDRLSRDMEDLAGIHKRLAFAGIELRAVHEGKADTVMVGLRGLVGQLFREDGAKKVRRGMQGVVRDGRHAGGRAYGYRPVPGRAGELEIVEDEANVLRRIFAAYAGGRPPREIAGDLNREGVAPPRGSTWNASTLNGNAVRGSGILLNELYAGVIVWNKVRMVKDPDTGRRLSRANDERDYARAEAPHLRIVDRETWDRAQAVKAANAKLHSHEKRQPRMLLSGLLRCSVCGSGMSMHDRDESGRVRVRCSRVRESGTCSNTARVRAERIEAAVLEGLAKQLKAPEVIEAYVRAYNEERQRLARTSGRDRLKAERRLDEAQRDLDRTVQAVVKGRISDEEADRLLPELRAERDGARAALDSIEAAPTVIALHPAAVARYLSTVEQLRTALAEHAAARDDRGNLIAHLRALIHTVTVHHVEGSRHIEVEVKGRLAALIGGDAYPEKVGVRVVAGEGLEPPTRGL